MKKKIVNVWIVILIITLVIANNQSTIYASSKLKKGTIKNLSLYDSRTIKFKVIKDGTISIVVMVEPFDKEFYEKSDKINCSVYKIGATGKEKTKKITSMKCKVNSFIVFASDLEKGNYKLVLENSTISDLKVIYDIKWYNSFAEKTNIPKALNVETQKQKNIEINAITPKGSLAYYNWETSNKKIARMNLRYNPKTGKLFYTLEGISPGKCIFTAIGPTGEKHKIPVTVKAPNPYLNYIDIELFRNEKFGLKLEYKKNKVIWSSTNNKIATVDSTGKVTGKGLGSCYIQAKSNGKTYRCKVKVIRSDPNFAAYITDYNTRNNYFEIKVKNWGKKNLTIYSSNAKAKDKDYKSFDRNLKIYGNKSSISIKGGKTKTIKFKVIGATTWPNHEDFWITYCFKYDGKKYNGRIYDVPEESDYKKNNKNGYYYTYWSGFQDKVDNWW